MADHTRVDNAPEGRGRIEVWRGDDVFGVSLYPDDEARYPGRTFTSSQNPEGFPAEYDENALIQWGRDHWHEAFRP